METLRPHAAAMASSIPVTLLNSSISISILLLGTLVVLLLKREDSKLPHANPPSWSYPVAMLKMDAKKRGMEIFNEAKKRFFGKAFRMISNSGEMIILPQHFANTIRNEEGLSFARRVAIDFQAHLPGFSPMRLIEHPGQVVQNVARKPLTKLLNSITEPLASEATFACDVVLGNYSDWTETFILDSMLDLIARLSSRVFLGDRLCRNEEWLKVTKEYTGDAFKAAQKLTLVPSLFKVLVPIFSADYRVVRAQLRRAQSLIRPVIEERHALKEQARKAGKPVPVFNDAIDWAEAECGGYSYDPASFQLLLSFAAIHTTSDLLSKIMLLLATEPTLMDPLREEMVSVLSKGGWSKTSLFNMKLVDSTMKEAQRVMPLGRVSMQRIAMKDVHLKGENITLRKGQHVTVDSTGDAYPNVFPNPEKFDIYRWLRLRETPDFANKAHFVSTSPEHLGFGHGMHACPGRFFAANEVKLTLCYLLLNYDWELAPGTTAEVGTFGLSNFIYPGSKLRYKRREAEIDLAALSFE